MILSSTWRRRAGAVALGALVGACGTPIQGSAVDTTPPSRSSSAPVRATATTARPLVAPDCSVDRGAQEPMVATLRIGPLLQVGDRTYLGRGPLLPATAALDTVGRVCRRDEGGRLEDGDGPYEPGTELRRVLGYDPRFRLGVVSGDRLDVWELLHDPNARVGSDVLDLSIGVDAIEVLDAERPDVVVTVWQDDERVRTVVDAIAVAPLDDSATSLPSPYRLVFRLRDGTTVERALSPDRGSLQGLLLGPAVIRLFATVPRPAPLPPPTTAATLPPPVTRPPGPIERDTVARLAEALDVVGDIEVLAGEQGDGSCINRLASPTLCVDVPSWGLWQYADVDAQTMPSATAEEAVAAATALLERLGLPVELGELGSNGPLITVSFRAGGTMMVAQGGRIAGVIAPTAMLPA